MYGNQQRPAGVMIPEGQTFGRSDKPSLTITGLLPMQFYALRFVDARGTERVELVVKSGDDLYMAPDGAQWLMKMRPLSDQMRANVESRLSNLVGVSVPTEDAVEVIADEISQATPSK